MALLGISTGQAVQLLVTANLDRRHSEAAFAHPCGAAPVPDQNEKSCAASNASPVMSSPHCKPI